MEFHKKLGACHCTIFTILHLCLCSLSSDSAQYTCGIAWMKFEELHWIIEVIGVKEINHVDKYNFQAQRRSINLNSS
jgi:hypothetical protein